MDKQIELLPCPFCGGKAAMAHNGYSDVVICTNQDCPMDESWCHRSTDNAAWAWNQRTTPTPPVGQVEAVAEYASNLARIIIEDTGGHTLSNAEGDILISSRNPINITHLVKASGAEHIAGLVGALEKILNRAMVYDHEGYEEIAKQALSTLPPELRRK